MVTGVAPTALAMTASVTTKVEDPLVVMTVRSSVTPGPVSPVMVACGPFWSRVAVTTNVEEPLVSVSVVIMVVREFGAPPGLIEGAVVGPGLTTVSVTRNVEDPTEEVSVCISVIWGVAVSPTVTSAVA